jgi:hypothetical protein
MNRNMASMCGKKRVAGTAVSTGKRLMIIGAVALVASFPATAQNSDLQQRLAAVKQSIAENKQRLQQYQWIETTQLTLKGDAKPPSQQLCHYGLYVPPDPQRMEQAYQAGKFSLNPAGDIMNLVFRDYAQPGDQLTLAFDTGARKITSVNVNTYMDEPKEVVTLQVQMASLPGGTNYVQQTFLDATAKKLQVTTTNSEYQKLGGQ